MINIAHFTKKFFIELVKDLNKYGVLFVVEDGNVYRKEDQAVQRISSKEKIAHLNSEELTELRYAKVTMENIPSDANEMSLLFEEQYKLRRDSIRKMQADVLSAANEKRMSDAEALELLEKKKGKEAPKTIEVAGVEYPFDAVRSAIKEKVAPGLHPNTGYDKTLEAYNSLSDSEKELVAEELKK